MKSITTVILAAGRSKRFVAKKSKLTQELAGLPIILHVYNIAKKISGKNIVLVCNNENIEELKAIITECTFVIQKSQKGTADAIETAKLSIKTKNFIVLFGDVPLVTNSSIKKLINSFKLNNIASMVLFKTSKSKGYGRVIINNKKIEKVIEEIDATVPEKLIEFCNSGIMMINKDIFFKNSKLIRTNKKKKEKFITDIFNIYFQQQRPFNYSISSEEEMSGINNLFDFNKVEMLMQKILVNKFLNQGVLIKNPETSYFSYDAKIGKKVIIESNVNIRKNVSIHSGTIIKNFSDIEGVIIKNDCSIGPHARIRPFFFFLKNCKIGNYVEIKNSTVGKSTSISHLTYVGDSKVGNNVNIGAGCVTCNYDGVKKHTTTIGNNSFVGSNTSLIAPIKIGNNVKIAAGSVINKNISNNKLAIRRPKLKIY